MGLISRKLCGFFLMFSTDFTSLSVLFPFPQSITFFFFMHNFFDSISSNIDEVLLINPSTVSLFGDFNLNHNDQLICTGGPDRLGELSQMTLLRSRPWLDTCFITCANQEKGGLGGR